MTDALGGFSFKIQADVSPAQQSIRALIGQVQQAGQQIQSALGGARPVLLKADGSPLISEAKKAEEALARVGKAAKVVTDKPIAITVRHNLDEASKGFDRLAASARSLGQTRFNFTAKVDDLKQADASVRSLQQSLKGVKAGEVITLNVRADSAERADVFLRRVEADIRRVEAAGARVAINITPTQQGRGFLAEAGRGFLQQATPGLATGAAAAAGVIAAQAVTRLAGAMQEAVAAGIRYNASLETSSVQMRVFLGSAEASAQALQRFQRIAEATPFSFREINESAASFAQVAGGNIERLERFVQLATQLAAVNPSAATGGGLEGATVAIREALAGDFTSIVERFRVSRAEVQRLRDLGLAGDELAVALVKAAGGSKELSDALANTFSARASKAAEILERLGGVATKPLFDVLSAGLATFGDTVDKVVGPVERLVAAVEKLPGGRAGLAVGALANPIGFVAAAALAPPARAQSTQLSPAEQQRQGRIAAAQAEETRAKQALEAQERDLKKIEGQLEANARAVREITERYQEQLRPLEAQQRALDAQIAANAAQGREIAARARAAEGPVEGRATNAARQVELDHERELLEIRHRRAEVAESLAEAEQAAANRAAEAQIRAAERALQAARDRAQAEREARQEVLEALREEIRGRQEARQAALEGIRDYIQAIQEARREALDAIREEIQARQEARREAIDALREQADERRRAVDLERELRDEARQAQQEAFAEQERAAERAHSASQERYRDQIDALRDQAAAVEERVRRESEAQRELAAFDRAERARQRAQTIASAERNVRQARTGRERGDALQRLIEIRAEQQADARREAIQARIERERQEGDRRREEIQKRIAELERKAREEDRAYQRERDARRDAFDAQQRAQQAADRAEDKAERERRRAEDAQIRAQEKADREQTKREQAEIRAAEKADREQTKAENAALQAAERAARAADRADQARLREEERAAREADRAAERALREQERAVAAQRDELQRRQAAQEEVREAARLARLRESADLEARLLANRQQALEAIDIAAKAQAEADRVRNEAEGRALADRKAGLDDQYNQIVRNRDAALSGLDEEAAKLTIARDRATELVAQMEAVVKVTQEAVKQAQQFGAAFAGAGTNDGSEAGPTGFSGPAGSNGQTAASGIGGRIAASIRAGLDAGLKAVREGIAAFLADDGTTAPAVEAWTQTQIIDPVEAILEIASPSKRAVGWAQDVAQGFIDGLGTKEREIVAALEAPWIEIDQQFWPEVERKWKQAGADHATAYVTGFKNERIQDDIDRCIDDVLRKIRENERLFRRSGGQAAREFSEGWCDLLTLRDCFAREMEWMVNNARAYGTQVGARFSTGFGETAQSVPGGGSSGGGGSATWFNTNTGQSVTTSGPPPERSPIWIRTSPPPQINGSGYGGSGVLSSRPQTRAIGGPVWPGQDFLVGEHGPELIRMRGAGAVIPHALTMSTLAGGGLAQVGQAGAVSISLSQTINAAPGMDTHALAQVVTDQAVAAIIDVLDDGERRAARPISRILPGALR